MNAVNWLFEGNGKELDYNQCCYDHDFCFGICDGYWKCNKEFMFCQIDKCLEFAQEK